MDSAKVIRMAREADKEIANYHHGDQDTIVARQLRDQKFAALIQQSLIDEGWRSPEQVKEYVELFKAEAVKLCEELDASGIPAPDYRRVAFPRDCAAVISKMELP